VNFVFSTAANSIHLVDNRITDKAVLLPQAPERQNEPIFVEPSTPNAQDQSLIVDHHERVESIPN
jgi:hypothetical protein